MGSYLGTGSNLCTKNITTRSSLLLATNTSYLVTVLDRQPARAGEVPAQSNVFEPSEDINKK